MNEIFGPKYLSLAEDGTTEYVVASIFKYLFKTFEYFKPQLCRGLYEGICGRFTLGQTFFSAAFRGHLEYNREDIDDKTNVCAYD